MINTTKKVLIIGQVWPEPTSSAAGTRMMQLIELFRDFSYTITFASTATSGEHSAALPAEILTESITLNSDSFDDFISKNHFDIVIYDRFMIEEQFGWRVGRQLPNAVRILNTEDLHSLRSAREICRKRNVPFSIQQMKREDITKREVASILRCDMTLMVSSFEIELLVGTFTIDRNLLFYLPLFFAKNSATPEIGFSKRKDFIFIGNFYHRPNKDAVRFLKTSIWPQLKDSVPEASMQIYGAYPDSEVLQMTNKRDRFFVNGRSDDANLLVAQSRVVLAPLRFGAGIKGKLLEAMANGTPSVTTEIGAEGISEADLWPGIVADDQEQFVSGAATLYADEAKWQAAHEIGFDILQRTFSREHYAESFRGRLTDLIDNLDEHRSSNFFGEMLHFHTLRSTEYLSRWIEEKQKKSRHL